MVNVDKNLNSYFQGEPPGQRVNGIRWIQKQVMKAALKLPRDFTTKQDWEAFRADMRKRLPEVIGVPDFGPMKESFIRARIRVGEHTICEHVDVYVDEDYSIPTFVFSPLNAPREPMPALLWNPGWPQDKWEPAYQKFAVRMAEQGFVVLIVDHIPFGETAPYLGLMPARMSIALGGCAVIGMSQLALRTAESIRCGEYLRDRADVNEKRVAVSGLCQGGMDTWFVGALDERFCAVAPICAETTFAIHFAEMATYQANGDSSPFPFGVLKVCDVEHLHAAVAPRPLLVRTNLGDNWWPVSGYDVVESLTRKVYKLYGAEEKIDFRAEAHEHNLTGPFADALESFLLRYV